jgi:hypothetical protein
MKRWDPCAAPWRRGALALLSLAVLGSGCAGRRAPPTRVADASPVAAPANQHHAAMLASIERPASRDELATALGETSDLATTFGAMESFQLPRTRVVVDFPRAFIVRPSGDLAPRGVVPAIAIETPVVEGVDDPVLARALQIVAAAP